MEDELSPIQRAILTTLRINGGRTEQWISQKYHLPVTTIERVIRQATERAEGLGVSLFDDRVYGGHQGALPLDSGVPDDPQPFDDTLRHNNNDDTLPRPNARLFSQFRQPAPTASIPAPLADATPFSPLLQPDAAPLDAAQHAASSSAEPNNSPQGPSFCTHHIDLTEGTTFPSFDAIRTLISMLSSTEGWEAQVSKRSKQRLVLNCRSSIGCPFHLHAKWDEVHSRALISILRPQHTCSQAPAHQRPTPIRPAASRMMFLLENVPKWLHVTSETSNKEIQDVVKARCGTEVRLQQCARLKTKLLGKRRMYMTKGPQGCSICGAQGHNARSCKNGGKKKWTWDERKAAKAEKRRAAVAAPKGQGMDADGRQGMDRGTKDEPEDEPEREGEDDDDDDVNEIVHEDDAEQRGPVDGMDPGLQHTNHTMEMDPYKIYPRKNDHEREDPRIQHAMPLDSYRNGFGHAIHASTGLGLTTPQGTTHDMAPGVYVSTG